jgi:N-acetylneuraminic acid mutarotase
MTRAEFDDMWERAVMKLNGGVNDAFFDDTWDEMNEVLDMETLPKEIVQAYLDKSVLLMGSRHGRFN